jgi:hypothetical protein
MKISSELIFLAGILFIVIILSISYCAVDFVPFSNESIFSREYIYEGLETKEKSDDDKLVEELAKLAKETKKEETKKDETKKDETKKSETMKEETKKEEFEDNTDPKEEFEDNTEEPKKVEGFQGLQPSPYIDEKSIDPFGQTEGRLDCDSISSGLHNSKGGLCLSKEQLYLLKTRGGNAKGGDFQIGSQH